MFQTPDIHLKYILIPGSEIPKWFSNQSEGSPMSLQAPSNFIGIVMCAVFVLHHHHPPHLSPSEFSKFNGSDYFVQFYYDVIGSKISYNIGIGFSKKFGKIYSHHIWLKYFSFKGRWDKELSQMDANQLSQIDVKIQTRYSNLEVMKCGARLVYEHDIEDLKQTMAECSSCSITPYVVDLDKSAKDTKIK